MGLTVGQELWYVPEDRRFVGQAHAVRITKIGRKWAEVGRGLGRVNIETLWVDGGNYSSPGRCWLSREAWEAETIRQEAWSRLKEVVGRMWAAPDNISEADIRQITERLLTP